MALSEEQVRRERLELLRQQGINPYPSESHRTHTVAQILADFSNFETSQEEVTACGRLKAIRRHGGVTFLVLEEESGSLQMVLNLDVLGEAYEQFHATADVGDFFEITGSAFVTKKGEKSLKAHALHILVKSVLPLPEKWHGLTDTEQRFRKRYLDLIMNHDVRDRMIARSRIITAMRTFLDERGFTEVETPTLQPVYGGGFARPFTTHHNALGADFFLRISDEMYLKRCLVGGMEKVYEITKVFRNEGIDRDHNPEFTMFEAQVAYEDYRYGMDLFEEMYEYVAQTVLKTTQIKHEDVTIEVQRPWKRLRLVDAVKEIGGLDPSAWTTIDEARSSLAPLLTPRKKTELERMHTIGEVTAFAFEELVEEKLIQPTIIYDYPIEVSPLAKKSADPRFTERFECFILGSEVGNNYSELNDPVDLEKRFVEEKKKEEAGFDEAHQTDTDYLEAIQHGMPPACGMGMGVDRMLMMLLGVPNIKEVILFPTLKPEKTESSLSASPKNTDVFGAIKTKLDDAKIPYITKHHGSKPEDSDAAMGFDPALRPHHSGAKAIILKGKKTGSFFHFTLPDDCKVDQKKIAAIIGERSSFASAEEVIAVTGCIPGSVPPFGSILGLETHVDIRLKDNEEIFFNAGSLTDSIKLKTEDFLSCESHSEVDAAE